MKNWYALMKVSGIVKIADPHSEETCHNCDRQFVVDLMWELPEQATTYKAYDSEGNVMNAEQAAQHRNAISREESLEKVTCPYCHTSWYSKFVRMPMQSNYPQEEQVAPTGAAHDALAVD